MPIVPIRASIEVEYNCSKCGATGSEEIEATAYVGGLFGIGDFQYPECFLDLGITDDIDDFSEDDGYDEDYQD